MPVTVQTDDNNEFEWETISTNTDADGIILDVTTVYDDQRSEFAEYVNGVLATSVLNDAPDSLYDWTTEYRTFDSEGRVTELRIDYDNNDQSVSAYVLGELVSVVQYDVSDSQSWAVQRTHYLSEGQLNFRIFEMDDTTRRTDAFNADNVRYYSISEDPQNAKNWTTIERDFDPVTGALTAKRTSFDNGLFRNETIGEGNRRTITDDDSASDLYDWTTRTTVETISGRLLSTQVDFDDGLRETETWYLGRLESRLLEDLSDTGLLRPWRSLETTFDGDEVASRAYVFNDVTTREDTFAGGTRIFSRQTDPEDAKNWTSIQTSYHSPNGPVTTTTYDNGRIVRVNPFADGGKAVTTTDGADLYGWTERTIATDANGVKLYQTESLDNGVRITTRYTDGVETYVELRDTRNSEDWDSQLTSFNTVNGLGSYRISYDDGSQLSERLQDGMLLSRREISGRQSDPSDLEGRV